MRDLVAVRAPCGALSLVAKGSGTLFSSTRLLPSSRFKIKPHPELKARELSSDKEADGKEGKDCPRPKLGLGKSAPPASVCTQRCSMCLLPQVHGATRISTCTSKRDSHHATRKGTGLEKGIKST